MRRLLVLAGMGCTVLALLSGAMAGALDCPITEADLDTAHCVELPPNPRTGTYDVGAESIAAFLRVKGAPPPHTSWLTGEGREPAQHIRVAFVRPVAIGTIVGALTCGKATPYLIRAFAPESYISVITISSLAAIAAGILVFTFYRDGPHTFPARKFRIDLVLDVLKHRPTRLAIAGYLGHMWELYAMWVWIPAFIASSFATSGASAWEANLAAFLAIATGAIGCVWGGWTADRIGRERLVNVCLAISGLTSLGIGLAYGSSPWIVAVCAGVWGFFVVADSAQFSTLVTEVSPSDRVGTALTLQTSIGFLLTTVTIEWVGFLKGPDDQWQWAFAILSIGPFLGIAAMSKLAKLRS